MDIRDRLLNMEIGKDIRINGITVSRRSRRTKTPKPDWYMLSYTVIEDWDDDISDYPMYSECAGTFELDDAVAYITNNGKR